MKKYKKIYVEITNICNLNCSFCSNDLRKKEYISVDNFRKLLDKINDYTDYIYLHVKGEPLLHPNLKELLDICLEYNKKVNITTNGTLIDKNIDLLNHKAVRQINISLHSENNMIDYLDNVFSCVDKINNKIINYRYWMLTSDKLDKKSTEIVDKLKKHYNLSTEVVEKLKSDKHVRITDNIFVDKNYIFDWPSLDNSYLNEFGYCYALLDQLAILVDGSIVPCCLDSSGIINLGNIYKDDLVDVINSKRYQDMLIGFRNRKACEELCKKCNFKDRLETNK